MGETQNQPFQLSFNAALKVDFRGSRVTSDGGLILVRELDECLGFSDLIAQHLTDPRGKNTQLPLADLMAIGLQSVGGIIGGTALAQVGFRAMPVLQGTRTVIGQEIQFPLFRNQITALLVEIAPGGETGRHQHPVPTISYVLEGTVTVEIEGHPQSVSTSGQAFLEPVNTWHNGRNRGTTPLKLLVVFSGEEGKPNLVRP